MLRQLERKNAQDEYERFEIEFATFMSVTLMLMTLMLVMVMLWTVDDVCNIRMLVTDLSTVGYQISTAGQTTVPKVVSLTVSDFCPSLRFDAFLFDELPISRR